MAKKAVATLQQGAGRSYSKVIKMVKSPKTGAYVFQEEIVHNDKVKEFFTNTVRILIVNKRTISEFEDNIRYGSFVNLINLQSDLKLYYGCAFYMGRKF